MDSVSIKSIIISALCIIIIFVLSELILKLLKNIIKFRIKRIMEMDSNGTHLQIPVKTCPFCGRNVSEMFESDDDNIKLYSVVCDVHNGGCGCSTGAYKDPLEAISAWNTRFCSDDE